MQTLTNSFKNCVQAFLAAVSKNMDALEDSVTLAEKELDPNALQKMFKTLPLLVCKFFFLIR